MNQHVSPYGPALGRQPLEHNRWVWGPRDYHDQQRARKRNLNAEAAAENSHPFEDRKREPRRL